MNRLVKYIVSKTYKPLLVRYLSRMRTYSYKNITVDIPAGVFHPKFFYSTKLLLHYIDGLHIAQKSFLELGAGSGLIAMYAAKKGAYVTATDINPVAVEYLYKNKVINNADIQIIHSDMFNKIPEKKFDVIAINPPYYKKHPSDFYDYAWYCGENGEYFKELFIHLDRYMHSQSKVSMSLCDGCDLQMIKDFANKNNFCLKLVFQKNTLIERNYIFEIELKNK